MLSTRLKELRLANDMTLGAVAGAAGVSYETVRRAENGENLNEMSTSIPNS